MASIRDAYIARIRASLNPPDYSGWISDNTMLGGDRYGYVGREYQQFVLHLAQSYFDISVKKPSQIGISELMVRFLLAICNSIPHINLAYILYTIKFAQKFAKTRFDPVLRSSPHLRLMPGADSSELKMFTNESTLYFCGASRKGQTISIPLDGYLVDEFDFAEDPDVLTMFESRLTAAKLNRTLTSAGATYFFSTPTVAGYGIAEKYAHADVQYEQLLRCPSCKQAFKPDYYKNVRLPISKSPGAPGTPAGFIDLEGLNFLTKHLLKPSASSGVDLTKAYIECPNPRCHAHIDQKKLEALAAMPASPSYVPNPNMPWVVVQSDGGSVRLNDTPPSSSASTSVGVHITPFSAPKVVTIPRLIKQSTKYRRVSDFANFSLGVEYDDEQVALTLNDLQLATATTIIPYNPLQPAFVGVDMGGSCTIVILQPVVTSLPSRQVEELAVFSQPTAQPVNKIPQLALVHAEQVPLYRIKQRFAEVTTLFKPRLGIVDALPYTETTMAMQQASPSDSPVWAAMFAPLESARSNLPELYRLRSREETEEAGKALYGVHVVEITRDLGLDLVASELKLQKIIFSPGIPFETVHSHILDLKRVRRSAPSPAASDEEDARAFTWRKSSSGTDHYFFALLYAYVASCMGGTVSQQTIMLPLILGKAKVNSKL